MRLICMLQFRDEADELDDWLRNVAPHVEGIVALDDGSTDSGADLLARHPKTELILTNPPDRPHWDEPRNLRRLVDAALDHGADWLLFLDADERVENTFRDRTDDAIAARPEHRSVGLRFRELWDRHDQYRCDGIWGKKAQARMFKRMDEYVWDERPYHGLKAPLNAFVHGAFPIWEIDVYHRGMLTPELRTARRVRYQTLDPEERYQPGIGYAYLTDETGLELRTIPPGREYWPA